MTMIKSQQLNTEDIIYSAIDLHLAGVYTKKDLKNAIEENYKPKTVYYKTILDKGFVELVDYLGNDLTTVNAARVSFNKRKNEFDEKDEKLMKFLKENEHHSPFRHPQVQLHIKAPEVVLRQCYDEQTEVLTNSGWKFWKDVDYNDQLAAVDTNGKYWFEKPSDIIKYHYQGKMVQFKSENRIDILVTPNHRMSVSQRKQTNKKRYWTDFEIKLAENVTSECKLPKLPTLKMEKGKYCDFMYGLLYGMYLGDGNSTSSKNRIVFSVKRDRKVKILDKLEKYFYLNASTVLNTEKYKVYHFDNPDTKIFCNKTNDKSIQFDKIPNNKGFYVGLLKGLLSSDGVYKSDSQSAWRYSTKSNQLVDDVIKLCDMFGYQTNIYKQGHNENKVININKNTNKHLLPKYRSMVDYNGFVYCASVSSGLLFVRRNNKRFVCGNCFKHNIGINATSSNAFKDTAWNEISRRYVEIQDFYIPTEFRKQHEKLKQSSIYDKNGNPEIFDNATNHELKRDWENCVQNIQWTIDKMIEMGVSKEQAQMLLPIDFYSEVYWTASFQALAHFCDLRHHHKNCDSERHSQWEIAQYANAIYEILYLLYPKTSEMWFNN